MVMAFFRLLLTTIIAIIIAVSLIYEYVYKFYLKVKLYPKGPLPLPFVGNCLMLITHMNRHPTFILQNLSLKYGDVFTFWLGSKPAVIISDISLVKNAFNKYEFSDRCEPNIEWKVESMFIGGHKCFAFMNISEEFKLLRGLSVQALRKFLSNNNPSNAIHEIVSETVDLIKQREKDNAFEPKKYIDSIFIRLITKSIFGRNLAIDDSMIDNILEFLESMQNNLQIFVSECIPLYNYVWNDKHIKEVNDSLHAIFALWYKDLVKHNENANNFGSIAESLNSSAIAVRDMNKSEINKYLNESNMIGTLITLVFGATDTSIINFKWILLFMAFYPEMQRRMRNEVNINIVNKIPDLSDKEKCVFVNAFICEILRFRNTTPYGNPHMTSCDTIIEGISIPKGTMIVGNQFSILNDRRYWQNPDIFNPERFIDSEQKLFALSDISAFIPFSTGNRMCPGDKFAMNTLFLSLSSLLQATNGYMFVLSNKRSNLEKNNFCMAFEPRSFKVILVND